MNNENLLSKYIGEKGVAEQLGVKPETLRVWSSRRKGPSGRVAVGRKIFYRRSAIAEWLQSREREMRG